MERKPFSKGEEKGPRGRGLELPGTYLAWSSASTELVRARVDHRASLRKPARWTGFVRQHSSTNPLPSKEISIHCYHSIEVEQPGAPTRKRGLCPRIKRCQQKCVWGGREEAKHNLMFSSLLFFPSPSGILLHMYICALAQEN